MIKRFVFYGLLGWCLEVFWTGLGSLYHGDITLTAQTYIWMFPIYGCAVFMEHIHDRIRHWPVIIRGGVYTVIIFSIEYITGSLLKLTIRRCPWNYGSGPLSIDGIITFAFIPVWFTAGLLFELVHNYIMKIKVFSE